MIWNPDAEPREALKEALLRGYGHLAYEDVEKITETLSGMDWHLIPGGQLRRLLGDSARVRELEGESKLLRETLIRAQRAIEANSSLTADDWDELTAAIEDADRPASVPVPESEEPAPGEVGSFAYFVQQVEARSTPEQLAALDEARDHYRREAARLNGEEGPEAPPVPEEPELKTPEEIAAGAMNRLCAYDGRDAPGDYMSTMHRVRAFMARFVELAANRLATTVSENPDSPAPVPVEEPEGRSPKDVEDALRYAKSAMVAAVPPSPAPESYDKHAGSPDSPQDRHNSAPEIKVGQIWEGADHHRITILHRAPRSEDGWYIFHGTSQLSGSAAEWALRQDYKLVRDVPPAPSLNPEGLAKLDAEIERLAGGHRGRALLDEEKLMAYRQAREWLVSTPSEEQGDE